MADTRQDVCSLEDGIISEKYGWKKLHRKIQHYRMKMELPIFEKKMFRRSLVAVRDWGMNEDNIEDNISNESVDLFASFDTASA